MFFKGMKFGMILQIAIGPVCLMTFNVSSSHGIISTIPFIIAVTLVDAVFVAFACTSVAAIINKDNIKKAIKIIGSAVLILFGAYIIIKSLNMQISTLIKPQNISARNLFIQGLVLTAANPLTIIFWSGVFAAQITEYNWNKKQTALYALGCVASTLFFLLFIAIVGCVIKSFMPAYIIKILNIAVGAAVIIFGIRLLVKKEKNKLANELDQNC